MNDITLPRDAWSLLVFKAQNELEARQQASLFGTQGKRFSYEFGVVELSVTEFRGARDICAVERFSQGAVLRVLHDRQIRGHTKGKHPA